MSSPPVYINTNDKVDDRMITTIVVPEDMRQELSAIRSDTYHCMTDIYNLRQDYNNYIKTWDKWLEERISNLESIVWRLEDYIENWIDTK